MNHCIDTSMLHLEKVEISEKQHGEGIEEDSTSLVSLCKEFQSKLVLFRCLIFSCNSLIVQNVSMKQM